jgi:hypothetical protein
MADDSALLWLAGVAVAGIVGALIGFALASAPAHAEPSPAFRAVQEVPSMTNHETIRWRDRRGRSHVIEVDRQVEINE